jgi:phosphate transport system substrate-binding protein
MRVLLWLIFWIVYFLFSAGCTQTPTPTVEEIELAVVADDSTGPLMEELAAAYTADRPNVTIHVESVANTERTLEALQTGRWNVGSVSWLPEQSKETLWHQPFARDGIVMVTHATNPINDLTFSQLRQIFQGQILSWSELGGPEVEVIPVSREGGAGTRLSFEALVMGEQDVAPMAVVMSSNAAVAVYVSVTPGAIGYISSGWLVPSVNLLTVAGATPSPKSVAEGRYLLTQPFYLVARVAPAGGAAQFVDWIRNREGQAIVQYRYAPSP